MFLDHQLHDEDAEGGMTSVGTPVNGIPGRLDSRCEAGHARPAPGSRAQVAGTSASGETTASSRSRSASALVASARCRRTYSALPAGVSIATTP